MDCPRTAEITARLLSPELETELQEYVNRYLSDPQFLAYHSSTTILTIRTQLELPFSQSEPCTECINNTLARCQIIEALEAAIKIRIGERRHGGDDERTDAAA